MKNKYSDQKSLVIGNPVTRVKLAIFKIDYKVTTYLYVLKPYCNWE